MSLASRAADTSAKMRLPDAAALIAGAGRAVWLPIGGRAEELSGDAAHRRASAHPPFVCHAAATAQRLGGARFPAYDLLDLLAFVRPARFCLPTPQGLAATLGLARPEGPAESAAALIEAARRLLAELAALRPRPAREAAATAATMARAGWLWGPAVLAALDTEAPAAGPLGGLDAWTRLGEWNEYAPEPPPEDVSVSPAEARERLSALLRTGFGERVEARHEQIAYAEGAAAAFAPRDRAGAPAVVLAEAGTGVGKTLAYIASASLWAEKSGGTAWLSTYTKNLQRQIDRELDRLYPDPKEKAIKVAVRKGRENYVCLLNFAEAVAGAAGRRGETIALGLMARWIGATRDGDMVGGDFPAWLVGLHGVGSTLSLTDRRGECVYSACSHYRKCFVERAVRKARRAEIVIANHALVMIQAALANDGYETPLRYVFDEGHHVFDAADSAFSAHLCGGEAAELRRWIRGGEGRRRSRARGLENRIGELVAGDAAAERALAAALRAALALPGEGWLRRIADGTGAGPCEEFLALVRQHVLARSPNPDGPYDLQTGTAEPIPGLVDAARRLGAALSRVADPLQALARALAARLDDEAADLDAATRQRIEAACRGLQRRAEHALGTWRAMLADLGQETPEAFVDWFSIERSDGRETDVGMHRHWIDPTEPFAHAVLARAHGALITSATLRDRDRAAEDDWSAAEVRTGATHLPLPARRVGLRSPFDHAAATRLVVVTDVRRDNPDQVAAAYRELFLAAGGGGLGLFTAIWRLRVVHRRIAEPLEAAGIPLYAQHVDVIDTSTLVDMFRADEHSCLLGTDAIRDGVDVPGRALRLIVFDRVPWPRPDILHRARREVFGGSAYDDMVTRLRLKQAYGRLLRQADDVGVFVMLDAMLPSRLASAFPEGVEIHRTGLAEAVALVSRFLDPGRE